ncbi:hypothetical protein E2C01_043134 [Portunus trituberculatus]|uniref:Uncharacterized protein n=1 Tax=Portunus trituberculatus TaxID=210409 RepID=A0A5B7FUV5_PORTR|nr:hypothetical protein [Portunus trituberculatus]
MAPGLSRTRQHAISPPPAARDLRGAWRAERRGGSNTWSQVLCRRPLSLLTCALRPPATLYFALTPPTAMSSGGSRRRPCS